MSKPVRYAVVGLGWIAQSAVLPAFKNAGNSKVAALVSGDARKLKVLGKKYKIESLYSYDEYEVCLRSGLIDAVYIALPNHLHADYTIRAARAGIHILCEKPMALNESECHSMITAAQESSVKLMIAYRLHFEKPNLRAIDWIKKGFIGEPRAFLSAFAMPIKARNVRLEKGGGPLNDLGVYCINAARYLYQSEPTSVLASSYYRGPLFSDVEEMDTVILGFQDGATAAFTCSFNTQDTSWFRILGTKGEITLHSAYEIIASKKLELKRGKKSVTLTFKPTGQFAPELVYFSKCIQKNIQPEPSGLEGLCDVRVLEAVQKAADKHFICRLPVHKKRTRPSATQMMTRPLPKKQELIRVQEPS